MFISKRARQGSANILSVLSQKGVVRERQGLEVYNFSIGTPDLPPDKHVMEAAVKAAQEPSSYKYTIVDSPELLETVQAWYKRRFDVSLELDEITSVYGTQEGMSHIFFTLCDPGDTVIVPTPLYPVFLTGVELAGAQPYFVPMLKENDFLIDLKAIPEDIAKKAKAMVLSYPNNPTTATAPFEFYKEVIAFAKKYDIFIVHDNAYGELVLDGEPGRSILEVEGAKERAVEFNSLSKSYNLTGARLSFAVGNQQVVSTFKGFRTQIDYGLFKVAEKIAIAALSGPQDILIRNRETYKARRDLLTTGLREIGWNVPDSGSTMFAWYTIPASFGTDDERFALELLEKTGVVVVPGSSFGKEGIGFVRMALVMDKAKIKQAIDAIDKSVIL